MARQRFIWPSIWTDPTFGRLQPQEQVMFIGLFSIADDDGRLMGSPEYLRGELYRYKDMSARKVKGVRDAVLAACPNVLLYVANEIEYIQLTKWSEYQRPKYPKPSKLPPPPTQNPRKNRETDGLDSPKLPPSFPQASPKLPEALEEASPKLSPMGWVGLGRDGLGRDGLRTTEELPPLIKQGITLPRRRGETCPECEIGGGFHTAGCTQAPATRRGAA